MKKEYFKIILLISAFLSAAYLSNAQSGKLDPAFGNKGNLIIPDIYHFNSMSLCTDKLGNVYLAGAMTIKGGTNDEFGVIKFKPNGTIDPLFGGSGVVSIPLSPFQDFVNKVALDKLGNIFLIGNTRYTINQYSQTGIAIVKLSSMGFLDKTFGEGGIFRLELPEQTDADVINFDALNNIYIGGNIKMGYILFHYLILKILPNGKLDVRFDGDGMLQTNVGVKYAGASKKIKFDLVGNVYVIGTCITDQKDSREIAIIKIKSDGKLDATFGTNGSIHLSLGGEHTYGIDLNFLLPESIQITASNTNANKQYVCFFKINSKGAIVGDVSKKEVPFTDMYVETSLRDAAGNSYLFGSYTQDGKTVGSVLKFTSGFILDKTFSDDGIATNDDGYIQDAAFFGANIWVLYRNSSDATVMSKFVK